MTQPYPRPTEPEHLHEPRGVWLKGCPGCDWQRDYIDRNFPPELAIARWSEPDETGHHFDLNDPGPPRYTPTPPPDLRAQVEALLDRSGLGDADVSRKAVLALLAPTPPAPQWPDDLEERLARALHHVGCPTSHHDRENDPQQPCFGKWRNMAISAASALRADAAPREEGAG